MSSKGSPLTDSLVCPAPAPRPLSLLNLPDDLWLRMDISSWFRVLGDLDGLSRPELGVRLYGETLPDSLFLLAEFPPLNLLALNIIC